mgnify:CR=1 FL=1
MKQHRKVLCVLAVHIITAGEYRSLAFDAAVTTFDQVRTWVMHAVRHVYASMQQSQSGESYDS